MKPSPELIQKLAAAIATAENVSVSGSYTTSLELRIGLHPHDIRIEYNLCKREVNLWVPGFNMVVVEDENLTKAVIDRIDSELAKKEAARLETTEAAITEAIKLITK